MEGSTALIRPQVAVPRPPVTIAGLRRALGDCLLGASFLLTTMPAGRDFSFSLAGVSNIVWLAGAAIMAVMSFARFAPRSSTVNLRTVAATGGMLFLPCLMRSTTPSIGMLATIGLVLELLGVALTQVARIYMGRRFGILPANRGIVSKGPFRWVRHPIYFGWFLLSIGYAMSFPSERNIMLLVVSIPLTIWRIDLEETHLSADPEYRLYKDRVPYRLLPGVM
ncbi:MAG: isoprenylcysteine carboxylmethyltransferase family protein [Candidatus Binatus sp.]|jgi:protein-S-isoprenylcysteine O-methyltransferase Ste14